MAKLLGYLVGTFMCFDGLLGILSFRRWSHVWRDMGSFFPAPVDQYFTEVMEVTEKYQARAPATFRWMWGLGVLAGLVVLRLASRR